MKGHSQAKQQLFPKVAEFQTKVTSCYNKPAKLELILMLNFRHFGWLCVLGITGTKENSAYLYKPHYQLKVCHTHFINLHLPLNLVSFRIGCPFK